MSNWLSVDPIALYDPVNEVEHYIDGQHNGGYYNPRNTSVYGYCYQSPVKWVDPNGKQSESLATAAVVLNFSHSPLAQSFALNYATGKGESMRINEKGMEMVRAMPVSVAGDVKFNKSFNSLKPSESKYIEGSVLSKSNLQGGLGAFTVNYQGVLTKNENGKDWTFKGQMSFQDTWDFDKKAEGVRSESSETATEIGGSLLKGGKGFDINSVNVTINQNSNQENIDWFKGKDSSTNRAIHNRFLFKYIPIQKLLSK